MVRELPKHDELFWPVVQSLQKLEGSADNDQLIEKVCELLQLPDDLTAIPHKAGPQSEIGYRVAWVKSWLKSGGVLDNPQRGVWVLTESGRSAGEEDVERVRKEQRELRRATSGSLQRSEKQLTDSAEEVSLSHLVSGELAEYTRDDWQEKLLSIVKEMKPAAFERLIKLLFLKLGFSHVDVVGKSGDGGIDLVGVIRINSVFSFRVLIQCKRYKDVVGPSEIRDFRGSMTGRTDKGIFITSGRYTRSAKEEAARDGAPTIDLIDGEALSRLLKEHAMGVETQIVEKVEVKPEYFNSI